MKDTVEITGRTKVRKVALDDKDEAIILCIERHSDIALKDIPGALKSSGVLEDEIPYPTVQRRVNNLIDRRVLHRRLSVNWAAAGYESWYRVGISIDEKELREKYSRKKKYDTQRGLA